MAGQARVRGTGGRRISREVEVPPLPARAARGREHPVDAGDEIFLVDSWLDRTAFVGGARRTRTAELSAGERAVVAGVLRGRVGGHGVETAYRGGGTELVLGPPARGKLLVSTEPLEQRHLDRSRFRRGWAMKLAALFAACHLLFLPYHRRNAFGQAVTASVTSKRHYTTKSRSSTIHHYELTISVPRPDGGAPHSFAEEVGRGDYDHIDKGDAIRAVAAPAWSVFPFDGQLGERAGLPIAGMVLALLGALAFGIGYVTHERASRPGYERKKVVDEGSGRLQGV